MDTLEFNTKIKELENQLKELLAKYPNQRVDFKFNDDYECYWKDKCYSDGDFEIFNGHNWYCEDRCTVRSIYINDGDDLSFDLSYIAYDHEGNRQEDEELEDVTLDYIIEVTRSSDWDFILSQLNFFAEILIVSPTEESSADVERKKYCPECGTEVKPKQKFCTECGTRLIEPTTLAPQPKTEPEKSKAITAEDEIQKMCNEIKARLIELGMTEFVWFGEGFDGSYDGEEPILPDDVDVSELLPEEGGLELRWDNFRELIRKVRIENDSPLFEVGGYEPFEYENWRLHENFTKDDLVNEYGEKAVKSNLEWLLASFEDAEILNLNKMIVRPKSNEKSKKKSESKTSKKQKVTSPKEEKPSKKKSEPKLDKELDKRLNDLYKMAVASHKRDEVSAMDYYDEYLDEAPASHSKYLDAHYGMASISRDLGDGAHDIGMDEEALIFYNDAIEHYEEILFKYPKKPFNNRLLAEVAYDKVREKIAELE